jgi:putative NADPH-quinone reductase
MRALIVSCHPSPDSYTGAIRAQVAGQLRAGGAQVRVLDLDAEDFPPLLTRAEWEAYLETPANEAPVAEAVSALRWADALIFIYPTWWYGLPARLKGWLDRVLLPGVAFHLPKSGPIEPGLTHIRQLAVFTTCGASRWLTWWIGAPGRRTILRGIRILCAPRCKSYFAAHYCMDASTPDSRAKHLRLVEAQTARMLAHRRGELRPAAA